MKSAGSSSVPPAGHLSCLMLAACELALLLQGALRHACATARCNSCFDFPSVSHARAGQLIAAVAWHHCCTRAFTGPLILGPESMYATTTCFHCLARQL